MRALLQRVSEARVTVADEVVAQIGPGSLVFLGVKQSDKRADAEYLAKKVTGLRIFPDENGKNNLSLADIEGGLLIVSQFTLYADTQRGNRPSYAQAAGAELAKPLYDHFVQCCESICPNVQTGVFQAQMRISLVNEGPITILCSSDL
ncbi:MAG TPA: D-aminoacyl-tRNA deacylase [Chthoniobacterales bacterium]|nr:D-aminoacyl-tRNA deacylase [Chthoniobacterales bacterium]